jgi:serine phosphatase RsbU (regulator of sigma subunit)
MLILLLRRLGEDRRENQRLAAELEAARSVQQLLISGVAAPVVGYSLDAVYLPAQEVAGIFTTSYPATAVGLHSWPVTFPAKAWRAALLVSMIVGALRETRERRPAPLLEALNKVALGQTGGGFVTCFCAQFFG